MRGVRPRVAGKCRQILATRESTVGWPTPPRLCTFTSTLILTSDNSSAWGKRPRVKGKKCRRPIAGARLPSIMAACKFHFTKRMVRRLRYYLLPTDCGERCRVPKRKRKKNDHARRAKPFARLPNQQSNAWPLSMHRMKSQTRTPARKTERLPVCNL